MSAEADIVPFDDEDERKADKVDGLLGEASHFYAKYGIYADGVSPWPASLPSGWDERLVRIETRRADRLDCACIPRTYAWQRSSPAAPRTSASSRRCSTPGSSILRGWLRSSPPSRCAVAKPKCCDMPNACSTAYRAVATMRAALRRRLTISRGSTTSWRECETHPCSAGAQTETERSAGTTDERALNTPDERWIEVGAVTPARRSNRPAMWCYLVVSELRPPQRATPPVPPL